MDQELEEKLTCKVCLGQFDSGSHRPKLLPVCGHTFCTSCINELYRQRKTFCPECRQVNAIKDPYSLPVNYGLLSISQARQEPASASRAPTNPPQPPAPQPHIEAQANHTFRQQQPASAPRISSHQRFPLTPRRQNPMIDVRDPCPTLAINDGTDRVQQLASPPRRNFMTRAELRRNNRASRMHSSSLGLQQPAQPSSYDKTFSSDKDLQEELDFQMAVHLTFCKDASHGHDDQGSSQHRCWQFPLDDELNTALTQSLTFQDYED